MIIIKFMIGVWFWWSLAGHIAGKYLEDQLVT
jgi:hypothetical protein